MKRKRIISTLSVVAAVLVILFGGIVIRNRLNDYSHILRLNWNLILPSDSGCSEIYSDDSGPSFHGDGIRYHVFNYEDETAIDTMVDWQLTEGKTRFRMNYSEAVAEWLDSINVPDDWRPEYEDCFFWYQQKYDGDEMIILQDKNQKNLYVAESFI